MSWASESLEVLDDLLLLIVELAGDDQAEKLPWAERVRHRRRIPNHIVRGSDPDLLRRAEYLHPTR